MLMNIVTLFPELVKDAMSHGVTGRAIRRNLVKLNLVNPRQFTMGPHHPVDDRPFGGGDGMLLLAEPLKQAIQLLGKDKGHVVFLSPQGRKWCDQMARDWSLRYQKITFICGRYGGVDQRFIEKYVDEEISLGDFILSGGEVASLAIMDSLIRRIPGALGNEVSCEEESFQNSLLECPQFTRPRDWEGGLVPEVLLSGDHGRVKSWRKAVALIKTAQLRPDLLESHGNSSSIQVLLREAKKEVLQMNDSELLSCGLTRNNIFKIEEEG